MVRQAAVVLYVLALVAVVVGVDVLFFRNRFWERLIVNVGIVLVFAAFYLRFLKPHERSGRRAAQQRDELAPPHSITSSARASSVGGTSRPSALAVLRLMTSSKLVGSSTGRSEGLAPLRMRSTKVAARHCMSIRSTP